MHISIALWSSFSIVFWLSLYKWYKLIGRILLCKIERLMNLLIKRFGWTTFGWFTIYKSWTQAYQELGLLLVLVAVAILTYASLVYFAEKENSHGKEQLR